MITWALAFLVIGIIAALYGITGIAGAAANMAWMLLAVSVVLAGVFFFFGLRTRA